LNPQQAVGHQFETHPKGGAPKFLPP